MPSVPCHRVAKSNGEIGGFAFREKKENRLIEKRGRKNIKRPCVTLLFNLVFLLSIYNQIMGCKK